MDETAQDDVPWLSDAQIQEWRALVALMVTLPPVLDAQLKRDAGLNTYEYHILVALEATDGHVLSMTDLALMARGSPSRLSHAVSRLERSGWVARGTCTDAGRRTSARLTPAGLTKLQDTAPGHVREVRRLVVDAVPPARLRELGDAARAIVAQAAPDVAATLAHEATAEPGS
jgi:DNA-binding MarR family transcriptional regulator